MTDLAWMDRESRVLTVLLHHGPMRAPDVGRAAGITNFSAVCNSLAALTSEGLVVRQGRRGHYTYNIRGRGKE